VSGLAQAPDCSGSIGEGSIRIPKPTWRVWDREKTGTSAPDLGRVKTKWGAPARRRFREIRYSGLLGEPYAFLSPSQGAYWDTQDGCGGPYVAMAAVSGLTPRIFITRVKL
jgi:hypothetical protein